MTQDPTSGTLYHAGSVFITGSRDRCIKTCQVLQHASDQHINRNRQKSQRHTKPFPPTASDPQIFQAIRHFIQRRSHIRILPRTTPRHLDMLLQAGERLSVETALRASVLIGDSTSVFGRVEVLLKLLKTRESDSGAKVTGVFTFGVFAVFRCDEPGQGFEGRVVVSDDGGRNSVFSLGCLVDVLIDDLAGDLGTTVSGLKVHRHGGLRGVFTSAEGTAVVPFVRMDRDAMLFEFGEGGERSWTEITVVVLLGLSSTGLADRGHSPCGGDRGRGCGSCSSGCNRSGRDNSTDSMNERISEVIS